MNLRVWANIDNSVVDLSTLEKGLAEANIDLVEELIKPNDVERQAQLANEADVVVSVMEQWDQTVLNKIECLPKLLMRYGAGVNNINVEEMTEAGVAVANIPGQNSAAVAEIALLHMLNASRRFVDSVDKTRKYIWPSSITGQEIDHKVIGLVGFGNIPKQLTRMLRGFEVNVLAYDKYVDYKKVALEWSEVTFVDSLDELFMKADIVSLHLPSTDETRGSINKALFSQLKRGTILVNTSRGDVVNEDDLFEALESGQIAYAGLDVLSTEPPEKNNRLIEHPRVTVTGHMGAGSIEAEIRSQKVMVETIAQFSKGIYADNVLNRSMIKQNTRGE